MIRIVSLKDKIQITNLLNDIYSTLIIYYVLNIIFALFLRSTKLNIFIINHE